MTKLYRSYEPNSRTARLMAKARTTNDRRDRHDDEGPFAKPSNCPLDIQLRTVLEALFCGIEMKDWNCVAEGAAMLQDAEAQIRP